MPLFISGLGAKGKLKMHVEWQKRAVALIDIQMGYICAITKRVDIEYLQPSQR